MNNRVSHSPNANRIIIASLLRTPPRRRNRRSCRSPARSEPRRTARLGDIGGTLELCGQKAALWLMPLACRSRPTRLRSRRVSPKGGAMRSGQAGLAAACFAAMLVLAALPAVAADSGEQQAIQAHLDRASELMVAPSGGGKPPRRKVEAAIKEIEAVIPVDPTNYLAHQLYGYAVYLMGDD